MGTFSPNLKLGVIVLLTKLNKTCHKYRYFYLIERKVFLWTTNIRRKKLKETFRLRSRKVKKVNRGSFLPCDDKNALNLVAYSSCLEGSSEKRPSIISSTTYTIKNCIKTKPKTRD